MCGGSYTADPVGGTHYMCSGTPARCIRSYAPSSSIQRTQSQSIEEPRAYTFNRLMSLVALRRLLVVLRGTLSPAKGRRKRSRWMPTTPLWLSRAHSNREEERYQGTTRRSGNQTREPTLFPWGGFDRRCPASPHFWTRIEAPAVGAAAACRSQESWQTRNIQGRSNEVFWRNKKGSWTWPDLAKSISCTNPISGVQRSVRRSCTARDACRRSCVRFIWDGSSRRQFIGGIGVDVAHRHLQGHILKHSHPVRPGQRRKYTTSRTT